jgi:hypothetical protein
MTVLHVEIIFILCGIMYYEFIREDATFGERKYKKMMVTCLQEALHMKHPRMSDVKDWILMLRWIYLFICLLIYLL